MRLTTTLITCSCLVLGVVAVPRAGAVELDYRLGVGVEYSDNIDLAPVDRSSDTVLAPFAAFVLKHDGERFSAEGAGYFEHRSYRDSDIGNELRSRAGLRADWRILPQRLSWSVQNYLIDQPIDTRSPGRPDNIQRTNVFITGPTLTLRPRADTRVLLEARLADTRAQDTDEFDSRRVGGAVRGLRELNPRTTVSANLERLEVDVDRGAVQARDFDRTDLYGRVDHELQLTRLAVEAGATRVGGSGLGSRTEPLFRAQVDVRRGESLGLDFGAAYQVSDATLDMVRIAPTLGDFDLAVRVPTLYIGEATVELFQERRLSAGARWQARGNQLRLGAYWREQDFLLSPDLDQDQTGVDLVFLRQVRPRLGIGAFAGHDRRSYDAVSRRDRDNRAGVFTNWQWSANLGLGATVSRASRSSNVPLQGYTDNRVLVTLTWTRR